MYIRLVIRFQNHMFLFLFFLFEFQPLKIYQQKMGERLGWVYFNGHLLSWAITDLHFPGHPNPCPLLPSLG